MGVFWAQLCGLMGAGAIVGQVVKQASIRARQRRAVAEFEPLAGELGLSYFPPSSARGQGAIRGVYQGRQVDIDPDDAVAIAVRFTSSPRVELNTEALEEPAPDDMVGVQANDKEFERFWRTRRAAPALAERLATSARNEWLDEFRGMFARNVRSVSITPEGVTVSVTFGRLPFIPADAIRALLPACAGLAEAIEPGPGALEPARAAADGGAPQASPTEDAARAEARGVPRSFGATLATLGALALFCKLGWAWLARAANDIDSLGLLVSWAHHLGRDVYAAQPTFGLPPPMVPVLGVSSWLADATGLGVGFWARALASFADAGTLLLLYHRLRPRLAEPAVRWSLLLLAAWPAGVLLSGQAGGVSLMVLLVLLSIHWIERRREALAGGAFGLALGLTLAPLYALPALVLARRSSRARLVFAATALLVLIVSWAPWWPAMPGELLQKLTHRAGAYGQWGVSWYLVHALGPTHAAHARVEALGPYAVFLLGVGVAVWAALRPKPPPLLTVVGMLACVVVVANPIFALSDLFVLAPLLVAVTPLPAAAFVLSSTALVVVVYAHWAGAGSWQAIVPPAEGFRGHADYFQLACIASIVSLVWSAFMQARGVPASLRRRLEAPLGGWRAWGFAGAIVSVLAVVQARADMDAQQPASAQPLARERARDYVELSSALLQQGRNDAGIDAARKATALEPDNAVAWNNLAVGLAGNRRWDEAIAAAERAVQLAPSFQLAKNNLAWARRQKQEAAQARAAKLAPPG